MGLSKSLVQTVLAGVAGKALFERRGIEWVPLRDRRGTPRDIGAMWAGATINIFAVIFGAVLISLGLSWVDDRYDLLIVPDGGIEVTDESGGGTGRFGRHGRASSPAN